MRAFFRTRILRFVVATVSAAAATPSHAGVIAPEQAAQHVGTVGTVCGVVASATYAASSNGAPTFLNLNRAYPDHIFTVVIWGEDRSRFTTPPEAGFLGRAICVSGIVSAHDGRAQMVVATPRAISMENVPAAPAARVLPGDDSRPNTSGNAERASKSLGILIFGGLHCLGYGSTSDAIRRFQFDHQIVADGVLDVRTFAALRDALAADPGCRLEHAALSLIPMHQWADPTAFGARPLGPRTPAGSTGLRAGRSIAYFDKRSGQYREGSIEPAIDDATPLVEADPAASFGADLAGVK